MASNRNSIVRGPGALTLNTSTTPSTTVNSIQFADDFAAVIKPDHEVLETALQGKADMTRRDLLVHASGTPLILPTGQAGVLSFLFPFANAFPYIGMPLFGSSDYPVFFMGNNGDGLAIYNAACMKADITLDIKKPFIDKIDIIGAIRNNYDPETANSYYKLSTGGMWSQPKLGQNSGDLFGRQRYYGNWAAGNTATGNATFTNFQGYEGIKIQQEIELEPINPQGRTIGYTLASYRTLARLIPVGPSMSDIDTCLQAQGTGAIHGSRLSQNAAWGDVIWTGQVGGTITQKNAVLVDDSFIWGGKPLRNGEIGFLTTMDYTQSPNVGGLFIAS